MVNVVKFMLVILFSFSCVIGCKTSGKVVSKEPAKEIEKNASSESPLAYEFKLNSLKGGEVFLSSYKNKKAVVLIFWTTWCPYCRAALKSLQEDLKSLNEMGVELLAINVGESENTVSSFVESSRFTFQVLLDKDSNVADHYNLFGVPTYLIINKSGQIVFTGNRFEKEKLKELTAK